MSNKPERDRKRFTEEEDALIVSMTIAGKPDMVIARRLKRTRKSVRFRRRALMRALSLSIPSRPDHRTYWGRGNGN